MASNKWDEAAGPREPMFRLPPVVLGMVATLVLIHGGLQVMGVDYQAFALYLLAFIPARFNPPGPTAFPFVPGSQYWSFLTHTLLHGGWTHLLMNCLWLVVFGSVLARRLSTLRFLALAAMAAAGGAAATLITHWGQPIFMLGASTAVSGIMAAAIPVIYGQGFRFGLADHASVRRVRALPLMGIVRDRRAAFFTLVWLGLTLISGASFLTGSAFVGTQSIAWEAHLGGFVAGLIAFYLLDRPEPLPRPDM